jgi:hypothetical protein
LRKKGKNEPQRSQSTQRIKNGIMEEWNIGILDKKLNHENPLFRHSIIPIFQLFADSSIPISFLCG